MVAGRCDADDGFLEGVSGLLGEQAPLLVKL